jgi:predicted neutral ceramidase superfamily lipid hydrolase
MADETPKERVDRELIELLNELRVALPGVQVLFAFLLTLPFTAGFEQISASDRRVYFAAVVLTALASMFLIAPSAHHRVRFRSKAKEQLLIAAGVYALIGLGLLALAMSASLWLLTDVLYDSVLASWTAGGLGAATLLFWFVVPRFYRSDDESG